MTRHLLLCAIIGLILLCASSSLATNVGDVSSLATCLAKNETDTCVLTVASLVWNRAPSPVYGIKTLTSTAPGGSTINIQGNGFVTLQVDIYGSLDISLTVEGFKFASNSASISAAIFFVRNSELKFKDVSWTNFNLGRSLITSQNASVSLENVVLKSLRTGLIAPLVLQDPLWTFINVTFDEVSASGSSSGIINVVTSNSGRNNRIDFGGNITILNVPGDTAWNPSADFVSILHDTSSTPVLVGSTANNPSNFVMRDSDINLFTTRSKVSSTSMANFTIGSIDVISTPATYNRFIFNMAAQEFANVYMVNSVHITGSIVADGIGVLARGLSATTVPNLATNMPFKVDGSLFTSLDGRVPAPFRLSWPVDLSASSITSLLLPKSSTDGLTPQFFTFANNIFRGSSVSYSTFSVENDLNISGISPNSTLATYTSSAAISMASANNFMTIKTGSLLLSNFTASQASYVYSSTNLAPAISVTNGAQLSISTTLGNISFSGNQNLLGVGGAIYIDNNAASKLILHSEEDIIFEDNTAYYGGAVYYKNGSHLEISAKAVHFDRNVARFAGGAAYLPKVAVTSLFPDNITRFDDNGAFQFGCVFAFADSFAASDASNASCPALYNASTTSGNHRLGEAYSLSETCVEYERLCDPIPPPLEPVAEPIFEPFFEPLNMSSPANVSEPLNDTQPIDAPFTDPAAPYDSPYNISTPEPHYEPIEHPILFEPSEQGPNIQCISGAYIPPEAACISGNWTISAEDAASYFSSEGESKRLDVPLEIIGGNAFISTIIFGNVLQSKPYSALIYSNYCLEIDTIVIHLSEQELNSLLKPKKERSLHLVHSPCITKETKIRVAGAEPLIGCQKVKVSGSASNAKIRVDGSRCNIWWIVLVSILGTALLTAVIIAVIYVVFFKKPEVERLLG